MLHVIKNKKLTVEISDVGSELMSIKTNADNHEYLWQGDEKYWGDRALVLFPICGRLVNGYYTYEGKKYEMELHGFIRSSLMEVLEKSEDSITFVYKSNNESKKIYPFDFTFYSKFTLDNNKLTHSMTVQNDGEKVLPYSIGAHPGFNVPFENENFEDCSIVFGEKCEPEMFTLSPTCFLDGKTVPFKLRCGKTLQLQHNLFDNDAIFLKNMAKSLTIKSKSSKKSVTVEYPDFDYVGFWQADHTDAPYVCVEPWNGLPGTDGIVDDFSTKQAMRMLDKDEKKTFSFNIIIK